VARSASQNTLGKCVLKWEGMGEWVQCDGQTHRNQPVAMKESHATSLLQDARQPSAQTTGVFCKSQRSKWPAKASSILGRFTFRVGVTKPFSGVQVVVTTAR